MNRIRRANFRKLDMNAIFKNAGLLGVRIRIGFHEDEDGGIEEGEVHGKAIQKKFQERQNVILDGDDSLRRIETKIEIDDDRTAIGTVTFSKVKRPTGV
jgi:hypothetical protein